MCKRTDKYLVFVLAEDRT